MTEVETETPQSLNRAISKMNSFQRRLNIEHSDWLKMCPNVLVKFQEFRQNIKSKRVAIFLDYDGTLTPIVSNPDQALMSAKMREVVNKLSQVYPVSIISGRSREKVESFVKLKQIFYSGSHGFDIVGPKVGDSAKRQSFTPASNLDDVIDEIYQKLLSIEQVEGAKIEHNKYCLSVHYRNVKIEDWETVLSMLEKILVDYTKFKYTRGRKVLEVRPEIDWDKGKALMYLLQQLGLTEQDDVYPIYLGDDRTDEDAFQVLNNNKMGLGILISDKPKHTQARYFLSNPDEVLEFLHKLALLGQLGSENGWCHKKDCPGWTCQYDFDNANIQKLGLYHSGSQLQLSDLQGSSAKSLYGTSLRNFPSTDLLPTPSVQTAENIDSKKIIEGFDKEPEQVADAETTGIGKSSKVNGGANVFLDEFGGSIDARAELGPNSVEPENFVGGKGKEKQSQSVDEPPNMEWRSVYRNDSNKQLLRSPSGISESHSVPLSTSYQNLAELDSEILQQKYNPQGQSDLSDSQFPGESNSRKQLEQSSSKEQSRYRKQSSIDLSQKEILSTVHETQVLQQSNQQDQKPQDLAPKLGSETSKTGKEKQSNLDGGQTSTQISNKQDDKSVGLNETAEQSTNAQTNINTKEQTDNKEQGNNDITSDKNEQQSNSQKSEDAQNEQLQAGKDSSDFTQNKRSLVNSFLKPMFGYPRNGAQPEQDSKSKQQNQMYDFMNFLKNKSLRNSQTENHQQQQDLVSQGANKDASQN